MDGTHALKDHISMHAYIVPLQYFTPFWIIHVRVDTHRAYIVAFYPRSIGLGRVIIDQRNECTIISYDSEGNRMRALKVRTNMRVHVYIL